MTKIKKYATLLLALGILALGTAFATAGSGNRPALPDEVAAAIDSGAVIAFYDADGNTLWSSDSEAAFDPALLEQVAEVIISDADGNVTYDLAVTTNPNGKLVIETDEGFFGLGALLKEAGITGAMDGSGMQNQERSKSQHQYQEQKKEQRDEHQAGSGCNNGCQQGEDHGQHNDHDGHHGSGAKHGK